MANAQRELFNLKWPVVRRSIAYHCGKRLRMKPADIDDVEGHAGLILWRAILRGVETISADWTCRSAISSWRSSNDRHAGLATLDEALDAAKPEATVSVDGATVTAVDAALDYPELVALWETGIGTSEAAERLGVSHRQVYQQADKLGGHAFRQPGRKRLVWRFPADTPRRVAELSGRTDRVLHR